MASGEEVLNPMGASAAAVSRMRPRPDQTTRKRQRRAGTDERILELRN